MMPQLLNVTNQLAKDIHSLSDSLHAERATRESQDGEIRRILELTETGGLNISLMGLVWLVLGITMSTIPNEIANIIK